MSVDQSVFDVLMAQKLQDIKDIFSPMVFHCGLPMSQRLKVNLQESWVLKLCCKSAARSIVGCFHGVEAAFSKDFQTWTRQSVQHSEELGADVVP